MSATALETRIMDLWDSGHSKQAIARQLGIDLRAVNRVFGYMLDREAGQARAIAQGSARLAAAIMEARA